jgi:hypothetical protein
LREQLVDPEEPVDLVEYEETQDATGASAGPATVQTEPVATETELVAMELEPVVTETEFAAAATARTTAEVGTDGEAPPRAVEAEPGWASAGSKFVARPLTSRLVRSATAIAAVFVLILLLLLFNGPAHSKPPAHPTAARKPAPGRLHTRANRTPTSATKQRSTPVIPAPTGPKIPVTVLNNSMVTGLAAAGAHDFAAAGWPVAGIGNLGGRLPQTTLFYGPGELASARALAARFHGITSIQPRPGWLPGSGLTVVLTRYFRP